MSEIDFFTNFRKNLQLLRINAGYSSEELCEKLSMTKKRITDLEYGKVGRGTPKAEEIFIIASFFKVPVEDIVHKKATVTF